MTKNKAARCMWKGALSAGICHLSFGICVVAHPIFAAPVQARIRSITTSKVGALTGPSALADQRKVDICGTDLGIMAEQNGRIYFAFGDTFGYDGATCQGVGGPNWRSNSFASTTDLDPRDGVRLSEWLCGPDGRAIAIIEGNHETPFASGTSEQTKIPTSMVSVDGTIYLHYMSIRGFAAKGGVWECNGSKWVYSHDSGKTWREYSLPFGDRTSNFNMLALTAAIAKDNPDGQYVYALGTPCGRFGSAKLGRVPKHHILEREAWEFFSLLNGREPNWTKSCDKAADVITGPVGEASLLWNPAIRRWMYTYLNEETASLQLREADHLWGPWSAPHTLAAAADYPQLYGAFMTPSFLRNAGRTLFFVMSQYGPYNSFLMKAELTIEP